MPRFWRRTISFFASQHILEWFAIAVAIVLLVLGSFLGWQVYSRLEKIKQLIARGESHLQIEAYQTALGEFRQAQTLAKLDLVVAQVTLSKDPQIRVDTTEKLIVSNQHFINGLNYLNHKLSDRAISELEKVDKTDPSWEFAQTKIAEVKDYKTVEKKVLSSFEAYYEHSLTSCDKKDWAGCISSANAALSLINDDYHLDKNKIQILIDKKGVAKAALEQQRLEAMALRNAYSLRVPVLMYHFIRVNPNPRDQLGFNLSVTPNDFEQQMAYLANNGYHSLDVGQLALALKQKTVLPSKPVVITFDDGFRDFYTNAFPILQKYNLHAESYVITGFVGGGDYMTWDMLREVQRSGLVTIGSHTVNHRYLTAFAPSLVTAELANSKAELENKLGVTVTDFCYPYGAFNNKVAEAVEKAGYTNATTTVPGLYQYDTRIFLMNRVRVSGGETLQTFIGRL